MPTTSNSAASGVGRTKQTFLGRNECLLRIVVFAEVFPKTRRPLLGTLLSLMSALRFVAIGASMAAYFGLAVLGAGGIGVRRTRGDSVPRRRKHEFGGTRGSFQSLGHPRLYGAWTSLGLSSGLHG